MLIRDTNIVFRRYSGEDVENTEGYEVYVLNGNKDAYLGDVYKEGEVWLSDKHDLSKQFATRKDAAVDLVDAYRAKFSGKGSEDTMADNKIAPSSSKKAPTTTTASPKIKPSPANSGNGKIKESTRAAAEEDEEDDDEESDEDWWVELDTETGEGAIKFKIDPVKSKTGKMILLGGSSGFQNSGETYKHGGRRRPVFVNFNIGFHVKDRGE